MNLLVLASSSLRDKKLLFDTLDGLQTPFEALYSVGETCHGWLEEYAKGRGLPFVTNFAQWYKNGKYQEGAGYNNKYQTIKSVDRVLIFWDGHSEGMLKCMEYCRRLEKKCKLVKFEDELKDYYLFSGTNHPFSLDFPREIVVRGVVFHSARHLLSWWCAGRTGNKEAQEELLALDFSKKSAAAKLKDLAQKVTPGPNNPDLEKGLLVINRTKFAQEEMRTFLAATKGDIVYCGPAPFGIGLKKTSLDIRDKDKWVGGNLLGKTLNKLRDEQTKVD